MTEIKIDCCIKNDFIQKTVKDLIDIHQFIAVNTANEYMFFHPEYTALFKLCNVTMPEPDKNSNILEFIINGKHWELKTLRTLLFCLSDNVDNFKDPLLLRVGKKLLQVKVKSIVPDW